MCDDDGSDDIDDEDIGDDGNEYFTMTVIVKIGGHGSYWPKAVAWIRAIQTITKMFAIFQMKEGVCFEHLKIRGIGGSLDGPGASRGL